MFPDCRKLDAFAVRQENGRIVGLCYARHAARDKLQDCTLLRLGHSESKAGEAT